MVYFLSYNKLNLPQNGESYGVFLGIITYSNPLFYLILCYSLLFSVYYYREKYNYIKNKKKFNLNFTLFCEQTN